ncbi:(d)CMP kinase, partial [Candidatus Pelagibacter sp.]|nr:(d)CMP kinase [Candidatus Pelagibacter sp.]
MKKRDNLLTVAIDSPAAAGAGTQAKFIAKEYNLLYLDTGKIYRFIANLKLQYQKKFNYKFINRKIKKIKFTDLSSKRLLNDEVATEASVIAKDKRIREIVKNFQTKCAYNPPKKFSGSVLDGRDITSVIMKDAKLKFYITANLKVRAKRRFNEFKKLKKKTTYEEVLKSLK